MANAYPSADLLLHHWGSVDAPDSAEGPFVAAGIAHDGGNNTFRYYLLDQDNGTAWHLLAQEFAFMGCLIDVLTPNLTALSCVPQASQSVADRLALLEEQGILKYETGRTTTA
jgi:hypothetical protein